MSRTGRKFEDLMAAASYAEEGESEAAREPAGSREKVLLVLAGRPTDSRSCKYAINMARRNNADVEVLVTNTSKPARDYIDACLEEIRLASLGFTVSKKAGCIKEAIISQTRKRSDILCVVVESAEILDMECSRKHRRLEGIWRELGCPLTLVSERSSS
ncbi:MAG: hypothetical protein ACYCXF_04625 [Thermoleophilia bacterium]